MAKKKKTKTNDLVKNTGIVLLLLVILSATALISRNYTNRQLLSACTTSIHKVGIPLELADKACREHIKQATGSDVY